MKKQVFLFLAAILVMAPSAFAYDFSAAAPSGQTLYYNINDGNAVVTYPGSSSSPYSGYTKPTGNLIIPLNVTHNGITYTVIGIGNSAFSGCNSYYGGCTGLNSVTIPNSVTSIGDNAFSGCSYLTSVTIGNSVVSVGNYAFSNCSGLTSVTIPNSVTSIGSNAFYNCTSITSLTIGNSVASISAYAFHGCSGLISVNIPNSVTNIGYSAFSQCTGMTSLTIGNSVTNIGAYAFQDCTSMTSIYIPNSVTSIGDYAFHRCTGLTSVTIGNGVSSTGSHTFQLCSGLTSVTIPNSVNNIGDFSFYECGLTSINIPNSVTSIGTSAFSFCSGLTSVNIPNSVTSIGTGAFSSCSGLTSINIPNLVTSISSGTFAYCSALTSITIPNTVTNIGEHAFYQCTGLFSVNIPNSVTSIGNYAFYQSTGLTAVTIGSGVTSIGDYAFYGCEHIIQVTCYATVPPTVSHAATFYDVPIGIQVYVPTASVNGYQTAPYWNVFTNYIGIGPYSISVASANPTMGTVTGGGTYDGGTTATLTATPNTGYHFVQWQDGNTQNPRTITVTGNATYTATFAANAAPASVTATISQVTSTNAHLDIAMGENTSYFIFLYGPQSTFVQNGLTTDEAILNFVNQNYGPSDRNYNNVSGYMNDLTPNTPYCVVVVPYNSNDEAGTIIREEFTTQNSAGTATVTATVSQITATSAHLDIFMGENTLYYIYLCGPQSLFVQYGVTTNEEILDFVNQNYGPSDRNYNNVSGYINDLSANTTYWVIVVPYNNDGVAGTICRKQFTTPNTSGIEGVEEEMYTVRSQDGCLTISGAEGDVVHVYSIDGRCIYSARATETTVIDVPSSGSYLVKVGNYPARKVVVIR